MFHMKHIDLGFHVKRLYFSFIFGVYASFVKRFSSATQQKGELGEHIACRFLSERGYTVIERNYTRKWGEIDIVARKDTITYFFEVKSVSREKVTNFSHETDLLRPEDQMHAAKQERLKRTIQSYILEHDLENWEFSLVCVYIDAQRKKAKVEVIEDLVL